MIKELNEKDWQNILEPMSDFTGEFEHAILLSEPAKQDVEDEFTKTQIAVKCSKSDDYYIFDNSGLVNMLSSGEKILSENNEYNVSRLFEEALDISYYFINYMCDKFGMDYIKQKLRQTTDLCSWIYYNINKLKREIPYSELLSVTTMLEDKTLSPQEQASLKAKKDELILKTKLINKELSNIKFFSEVQNSLINILEDDIWANTYSDNSKY